MLGLGSLVPGGGRRGADGVGGCSWGAVAWEGWRGLGGGSPGGRHGEGRSGLGDGRRRGGR